MTKRVQIAGGPASSENLLIGFDREVTAVTDSHELRLHDGVKVGGFRFLPLSVNDLRYQKASPELDTFSALTTQKGIMVRLGAQSIVTRQITGTTGEIDVTNPAGFAGDFILGLPTQINKAGMQFVQSVEFLAGIVSNVTGDVTGNLTGNANGSHTGSFLGNVDVTGFTFTIPDGAIPLSKLAAAVALSTDLRFMPSGGIILWSGSVATIPAGWVLCDGLNGTPDLRDRFVIGASTTGAFAVGATGGVQTHGHTPTVNPAGTHSHVITVDPHVLTIAEIPAHEHGNGYGTNNAAIPLWNQRAATGTWRFDNNSSNPNIEAMTSIVGGGLGHVHTASAAIEPDHVHTASIDSVNHMPPHYALAYIMKT